MEILTSYGVPTKIVEAINILYKDTVAQVLTPDGGTEFFDVVAGVLQGDTLAPFLFIIALDYALREATRDPEIGFMISKRQGSQQPAVCITDTDFADDLALLSNYVEQAQLFLLMFEIARVVIGLHVNCKKTDYVLYNQADADLITLEGKKLKQVEDFKYLGSWIESSKKDMEIKIGLAWQALNKVNKLWKSNLEKWLKIQFFRATVENVFVVWCRVLGTYKGYE